MPLLFLTQVAFIVAFGVLLDTFVVAPWSCRKPSTCSEIGCGGPAGWPAPTRRPRGPPDPAELASSRPAQSSERGIPRLEHERLTSVLLQRLGSKLVAARPTDSETCTTPGGQLRLPAAL
jgi:hypothetical protein